MIFKRKKKLFFLKFFFSKYYSIVCNNILFNNRLAWRDQALKININEKKRTRMLIKCLLYFNVSQMRFKLVNVNLDISFIVINLLQGSFHMMPFRFCIHKQNNKTQLFFSYLSLCAHRFFFTFFPSLSTFLSIYLSFFVFTYFFMQDLNQNFNRL